MSNQRGMLLLLVLCLGGCLKASPITSTPASSEVNNTNCIEDVEGTWLEGLEAWTAVPPEVLQQWNTNEEDNAPVSIEVTLEAEVFEIEATSEEPSVTEAPVTVHPEQHHNHESPLKITFEGLRRKQLLNPNKDYTVVLESYIGTASQFLVIVSPYSNTSECSSGGFLPPNLDVENKAWTHAEDEIPKQGNSSVEVGSCFFSAQGQLEASDHVLLTYTPPECGCVSVRGYIAIVNGNHSEVAGPQEVPDALDRLLCVDPHPDPTTENADIEENEVEITDGESSTVEPLVESGEIEGENIAGLNKGRLGKAERKAAKKNRRKAWRQQMKKTRGRAGWRQFKQKKRQRKQAKAARKQVSKGNAKPQRQNKATWKIVKPLKPWKQQRKMWKQHKKHGKAGKWWKKGRRHGHNEGEKSFNQTTDEHQHHNDTDEIHEEELSMEEELEAENNALIEELLANSEPEELTTEGVIEKPVREENTDENEVDTSGRKMQKGHGKWKGKRKWHKKKNDHKQGVTFCCSQGIRTKKFILRLIKTQNLTASNDTVHSEECILRKESVVTIFAGHNFSLKEDTCVAKFGKCCNNFTQKRWDQIIAKRQQKRQARKLKRKTAKHSRKQAHKQNNRHQKQERKQERQQERKQQRQQNRRNNNARRGNQDVMQNDL